MGDERLQDLSKLRWSKKSQMSNRAGWFFCSVKKKKIFIKIELLLQILLFLLSSLTCKQVNETLTIQVFLLLFFCSEWQIREGKKRRGDKAKKNIQTAAVKLEVKVFCRDFLTIIKKILQRKLKFSMSLQLQFFNSTEKIFETGCIMKWNAEKDPESYILQEYLLTHLLLWLTLSKPVKPATLLKVGLCWVNICACWRFVYSGFRAGKTRGLDMRSLSMPPSLSRQIRSVEWLTTFLDIISHKLCRWG